MQTVVWVVLGIALVVVVVVVALEARIMHKPEAERAPWERRFLRVDRGAARVQQTWARNVMPWMVAAVAVVGLVALAPLWAEGRVGVAAGLSAMFVVLGGGAVLLWATVLRKRGAAWRSRQDDENRRADADGRPRWFVSVKAGYLLGGAFTVIGLLSLLSSITMGGAVTTTAVLLAVGVLFLVLAALQQRGERRAGRRPGSGADRT